MLLYTANCGTIASALQRRYLNRDEFVADFIKTVDDKFESIAGEDW